MGNNCSKWIICNDPPPPNPPNPPPPPTPNPMFKKRFMFLANSSVSYPQWTSFTETHFKMLANENSRIMVLSGTHGGPDGKFYKSVKRKDGTDFTGEKIFSDDKDGVEEMKQKHGAEIARLKMIFNVTDVWEDEKNGQPDIAKLVTKIRTFAPKAIICAWCFSQVLSNIIS